MTVNDITLFVTARARAATHPIFGKIANESKSKPLNSKARRDGPRGSGFSTQGGKLTTKSKCPLCNADHWLSRCEKFRKQSIRERQDLVRAKKLCINCLSGDGHFVRDCPTESFCKVHGCNSKHSTFLHPKTDRTKASQESTPEIPHANVKSNTSSTDQLCDQRICNRTCDCTSSCQSKGRR